MRSKRPFYIPIVSMAPMRVPLTPRERQQIPAQRELASVEQARIAPFLRLEFSAAQVRGMRALGLSDRQILAAGTRDEPDEPDEPAPYEEPSGDDGGDDGDTPPAVEDIEREAIEEEGSIDDYDMPDWDDEFFDEWGDEIDYEIFTVLS